MATVTAIITAHNNAEQLEKAIAGMLQQTKKPDQFIIMFSDLIPIELELDFLYIKQDNKNDWGHNKRDKARAYVTSDFFMYVNQDDEYASDYIETMLKGNETQDFIFCDFNTRGSNKQAGLQLGHITSGCYLVRSTIGKSADYSSRRYEADWDFINSIINTTKNVARVPGVRYWHK